MRTKTSQRGLTSLSLTSLLLLNLFAASNSVSSQPAFSINQELSKFTFSQHALLTAYGKNDHATTGAAAPCPVPTIKVGSQCVLTNDATLRRTLVLPSDTTLDCRGHKLSPTQVPSPIELPPQVGIFLNSVQNVHIHNCLITGFDFGIFAINSKMGAVKSFEMTGNTIEARYTGVSLMAVDNAAVVDNDISYTRAAGKALYIGRNSDQNKIVGNRFLANLTTANVSAFRAPGPASDLDGANPIVTTPGAVVVITQIEGPEPTLLNAVINGTLFQLKVPNTLDSSSQFSEGNVLERNIIRFTNVRVDGVAVSLAQSTIVQSNKIEGRGRVGIRIGIQNAVRKTFPGECIADLRRRACLSNAGCQVAAVSNCRGFNAAFVNWITRDTWIVKNTITGPFESGINTTGQDTLILENTIEGEDSQTANNESVGIRLIGKHALETARIQFNSVSRMTVALHLTQLVQGLEPLSFGAQVSLNDFTGYETGVRTSMKLNPADSCYDLPSELSANGRGNFWGTQSCIGLSPGSVRKTDNSLEPLVTDRRPYNTPVATVPAGPSPCPMVSVP